MRKNRTRSKNKSKAKDRRKYKSGSFVNNVNDTGSDASFNNYSNSSEHVENTSFIDHRKFNNLANMQSSPMRARRRKSIQAVDPRAQSAGDHQLLSLSNLPLTNRNLQALARLQSAENRMRRKANSQGPVAIDMDKYAKEQQKYRSPKNEQFPRESEEDDRFSINTMEFGESNPPSEHSGDSTSLDDVCFPDYYNDADAYGNKSEVSQWPDIKILEEFVKEEQEELTPHNEEESAAQGVNFHYPISTAVESKEASPRKASRGNLIADEREDTPLLHNAQINEADSLKLTNESLRVRPQSIQPWEKSKENITTILHNFPNGKRETAQSSNLKHNSSVCRFTYFREDLEKTIHSPTISGLLAADLKKAKDSPKLAQEIKGEQAKVSRQVSNKSNDENRSSSETTLYDLFMPSYYSRHYSLSSSSESIHGAATPALMINQGGITNDGMPGRSTRKLEMLNSLPDTATNSVIISREDEFKNPFWLDVLDPTEEEMKVLSKTFGIHPLTTEDIFLGEAREKVELFKSYYFICFTSFDIVYERRIQRAKEHEKKLHKLHEMLDNQENNSFFRRIFGRMTSFLSREDSNRSNTMSALMRNTRDTSSNNSRTKRIREGELMPLNMYIIIFKDAVITFHFSPTPHPINVRRRARLLRDYLTVSSDWICYALIDDITDSFAPMIESIETEVNQIEDAILKMHSGSSDSESDYDSDDYEESFVSRRGGSRNRFRNRGQDRDTHDVFFKRERAKSVVEPSFISNRVFSGSGSASRKSSKSSQSGRSSRILAWKRKGDMLRRIGECRKRVMSILRLLGSKADVIKGFSKRFSEPADIGVLKNSKTDLAPSPEIGMYLGDIQDHIVTMVQSLNHYEKLLARFHSNYLAQINIDMTKVNNDTNDVLGKITIIGTIVLPINIVTGLWGMNCVVPGQEYDGLAWFWSIIAGMFVFSILAFNYAKKVTGL